MSEVAHLLMDGHKLTKEQYEEAIRAKLLTGGSGKSTYEGFLCTYYEDDKTHGYICGKHEDGITKTELDGITWQCGFGLHATRDLKWEYLNDINIFWLAAHFGHEAVKRIQNKKTKKARKGATKCTTTQ